MTQEPIVDNTLPTDPQSAATIKDTATPLVEPVLAPSLPVDPVQIPEGTLPAYKPENASIWPTQTDEQATDFSLSESVVIDDFYATPPAPDASKGLLQKVVKASIDTTEGILDVGQEAVDSLPDTVNYVGQLAIDSVVNLVDSAVVTGEKVLPLLPQDLKDEFVKPLEEKVKDIKAINKNLVAVEAGLPLTNSEVGAMTALTIDPKQSYTVLEELIKEKEMRSTLFGAAIEQAQATIGEKSYDSDAVSSVVSALEMFVPAVEYKDIAKGLKATGDTDPLSHALLLGEAIKKMADGLAKIPTNQLENKLKDFQAVIDKAGLLDNSNLFISSELIDTLKKASTGERAGLAERVFWDTLGLLPALAYLPSAIRGGVSGAKSVKRSLILGNIAKKEVSSTDLEELIHNTLRGMGDDGRDLSSLHGKNQPDNFIDTTIPNLADAVINKEWDKVDSFLSTGFKVDPKEVLTTRETFLRLLEMEKRNTYLRDLKALHPTILDTTKKITREQQIANEVEGNPDLTVRDSYKTPYVETDEYVVTFGAANKEKFSTNESVMTAFRSLPDDLRMTAEVKGKEGEGFELIVTYTKDGMSRKTDIVTSPLFEEGSATNNTFMGSKLAQWTISNGSRLTRSLIDMANMTEGLEAFKLDIYNSIARPFFGLGRKSKAKVSSLLAKASADGVEYELSDLVHQLTPKEIEGFYAARAALDVVYQDTARYKMLQEARDGVKVASFAPKNSQKTITSAKVQHEKFPHGIPDELDVWDPARNTARTLTKEQLVNLEKQGFFLWRTIDEKGAITTVATEGTELTRHRYIITTGNDTKKMIAEPSSLRPRKGYLPTFYKNNYFVDIPTTDKVHTLSQTKEGHLVNGEQDVVGILTPVAFDSQLKAIAWAKKRYGAAWESKGVGVRRDTSRGLDTSQDGTLYAEALSATSSRMGIEGGRLEDPFSAIKRSFTMVANKSSKQELLFSIEDNIKHIYGTKYMVDTEDLTAGLKDTAPKELRDLFDNYYQVLRGIEDPVDEWTRSWFTSMIAMLEKGSTTFGEGIVGGTLDKLSSSLLKRSDYLHKNPLNLLSSSAYAVYIAMRPNKQLPLQLMQLLTVGGTTGSLMKGVSVGGNLLTSLHLAHDNKALGALAKMSGMTLEEFDRAARAFRSSGLIQSIDRHDYRRGVASFAHDYTTKEGLLGRTLQGLKNLAIFPIRLGSKVGFEAGEAANRAGIFGAVLTNFKKKNGHFPLTEKDWAKVSADTYQYVLNPNKVGSAKFTRNGILRLPTQFFSFQIKMWEALLIQPHFKGSRTALVATNALMYGPSAFFLDGLYERTKLPIELQDKLEAATADTYSLELLQLAKKFMEGGAAKVAIDSATGSNADVRGLAPFRGLEMLFNVFAESMGDRKSAMSLFLGAGAASLTPFWEGTQRLFKSLAVAKIVDSATVENFLHDMQSALPVLNDIEKARAAYTYSMLINSKHGRVMPITTGDAIPLLFGIPPKGYKDYINTRIFGREAEKEWKQIGSNLGNQVAKIYSEAAVGNSFNSIEDRMIPITQQLYALSTENPAGYLIASKAYWRTLRRNSGIMANSNTIADLYKTVFLLQSESDRDKFINSLNIDQQNTIRSLLNDGDN